MEFRFKKILYRGEQRLKFIGFKDVKDFHCLPMEYTSAYPKMYKNSETHLFIAKQDGDSINLDVGDEILKEQFNKIMSLICECGDRLHEINEKLKKQNENWKGEFNVVI